MDTIQRHTHITLCTLYTQMNIAKDKIMVVSDLWWLLFSGTETTARLGRELGNTYIGEEGSFTVNWSNTIWTDPVYLPYMIWSEIQVYTCSGMKIYCSTSGSELWPHVSGSYHSTSCAISIYNSVKKRINEKSLSWWRQASDPWAACIYTYIKCREYHYSLYTCIYM